MALLQCPSHASVEHIRTDAHCTAPLRSGHKWTLSAPPMQFLPKALLLLLTAATRILCEPDIRKTKQTTKNLLRGKSSGHYQSRVIGYTAAFCLKPHILAKNIT